MCSQRYRKTPPYRIPSFPSSQRSTKRRNRLNPFHLEEDGRKCFQEKLSCWTQPFLSPATTVFRIRIVEFDASNRPVRVTNEPAGHEMVQIVRDGSEGNRLVPEDWSTSWTPRTENQRVLTHVHRGEIASTQTPRVRFQLP
jgi:hypothetical protein